MESSAASIWSAVAASFSALAAITIMRIQHRNMLDEAKPDIIITGWDRKTIKHGEAMHEVITFEKIRNIGKGPALHLYINCVEIQENRPQAVLSTKRLSVLPTNEEHAIEGEIALFWQNVPSKDGGQYLPIKLSVYYWCTKGYRHVTTYTLMAIKSEGEHIAIACDQIAPGLMLSSRQTVSKAVWRLKLARRLSRIPLLGKCLPKDD